MQYDEQKIAITRDDDNTVVIHFDDFQKLFYVAYAITIYKSQGSTLDYLYKIHGFHHPLFDDEFKYMSLSRSAMIENIDIII